MLKKEQFIETNNIEKITLSDEIAENTTEILKLLRKRKMELEK